MISRSQSTDKRYYGVVEGVVVDNKNDPHEEGRVLVNYKFFDDDMISDWARVCQKYAGNGFGAVWTPEVDSEVVVAFYHGDMRLPVILGCVYNGQDKPATFPTDDVDAKWLQTKAGHRVVLDDSSGAEKIEIVDKSGNNSIVIDTANNTITIEAAKGELILKGKNGITIESQAGIDITASSDVNVQGSTINLN